MVACTIETGPGERGPTETELISEPGEQERERHCSSEELLQSRSSWRREGGAEVGGDARERVVKRVNAPNIST